MEHDARTRLGCRLCGAAIVLSLALGTDSHAQNGQWTLGVYTETISEVHRIFGDPPGGSSGPNTMTVYMLRVNSVVNGSAAERAGLKRGDVIESVNGKSVRTPNELARLVRGSNGVVKVEWRDKNGDKSKTIDLRGANALAAGETFVPHIGIYYEKVAYDNGTFGARLTRDALPGSATTQLRMGNATQLFRLEKGDTIFEMDGQRFRTDDEVRNHRGETTMRFIDGKSGRTMEASLTLP